MPEQNDRAYTLLDATYRLMKKANDSPLVLDILSATVVYDDCECDGYCLMNDIDDYLQYGDEAENMTALAHCDKFICSECGIVLKDWSKMESDDDGEEWETEYEFKFCPNCGRRIKEDATD